MYAVVHFASLVRREAARANAPAVPTTDREIVLGSNSQAGAVAVRSGDVALWRTKFSPRVLLAACLALWCSRLLCLAGEGLQDAPKKAGYRSHLIVAVFDFGVT